MIRRRPRGLLALLPTEYVWVYPHDADWYEQRLVATNAMSRRQRPRRRRIMRSMAVEDVDNGVDTDDDNDDVVSLILRWVVYLNVGWLLSSLLF